MSKMNKIEELLDIYISCIGNYEGYEPSNQEREEDEENAAEARVDLLNAIKKAIENKDI